MVQPGMYGAGVYQLRKGHLVDAPQALVPGMGHELQDKGVIYGDKPIYRVIDDFPCG
jgi:hypothetical protein